MFARITFVQVKPQDIQDASRLFDESVVPEVRQEQGFRGALLLVRDTGEAMAVDFAESLEDLNANERNGVYQAQVAKFRDRIIGHPRREVFRVAVAKGLSGGVELLEDPSS